MATLRQRNANRTNSLKSTGPKTAEGKEASRANALKHGLAGEGIVLPDEEKEAIRERIEFWHSALKPDTLIDLWLGEVVATESVRVERCRAMEQRLREEEARRADESWDDDRQLAAAKLAAKLARHPEVVSRELATTSQGVDLLIERWTGLASILETQSAWNDAQRSLALDLLGVPRTLRDARSALDDAVAPGGIGLPGVIAGQVEKLLARKSALEIRDGRDQATAMLGLGPASDELKRIQRYESACQRRLQWAYTRLKTYPIHAKPEYPPTPPAPRVSYTPPPLLASGQLADSLEIPEPIVLTHNFTKDIPTSDDFDAILATPLSWAEQNLLLQT